MKNKRNRYVTKMNLYIRILVAGYVVYLAYELVPSVRETVGSEKIWMILATAFLAIAGIVIVAFSVKGLIRKEYYDADEIAEMEAAREEKKEDIVEQAATEAEASKVTEVTKTEEENKGTEVTEEEN